MGEFTSPAATSVDFGLADIGSVQKTDRTQQIEERVPIDEEAGYGSASG